MYRQQAKSEVPIHKDLLFGIVLLEIHSLDVSIKTKQQDHDSNG
jgi:hypothetical protein